MHDLIYAVHSCWETVFLTEKECISTLNASTISCTSVPNLDLVRVVYDSAWGGCSSKVVYSVPVGLVSVFD